MIELKNVSKRYVESIKAVDDLSLEIRKGEIFGFLGPNGAGKTTTIKMITGITNFDSGEIFIDGINIKTNPLACKRNFGYVPDNPDMFLRLKGIEYLNFMAEIYNVPVNERKIRIKDLCDRFEMEGALSSSLQSYSHGMRQKIVLIGVLIHKPSNWILDEPMTGLDPRSSHLLKQMMKEHTSEGNSVFFSTHVLEVAEKLCDRVGIIDKGKLLFCGTYDEIKAKFNEEASLENIFLEMTDKEK